MRFPLPFLMVITVKGLPTFLISSPTPWCVAIDGVQDEALLVEYEAPDLLLDRTDKRYTPTYLTIDVIPTGRIIDTDLHSAPIRERLNPFSKIIDARKGQFTHNFEVAGQAKICIRSSDASSNNPKAFAIRVQTSEELPEILLQEKKEIVADVDQHLSHMEREWQRIQSALVHVVREADFNKSQDEKFHEQTIAMHSAATFWPIVQVCVLLMTGFTQASHIVRFFKSRRII